MNAATARSPIELRAAGMAALAAALGRDGAAEFLAMGWGNDSGGIPGRDFAKWLNEQPEPTNEEFVAEVLRVQAASTIRREVNARTRDAG